jgi:hypothetical protein
VPRISNHRPLIFALSVALLCILLLQPTAVAEPTATLTHVTRSSAWSPPSPDPMGLAYHPSRQRLMVIDSEVEETPLFQGKNAWLLGMDGEPRRAWSLTTFTMEPTDVAAKGRRTLFFIDDVADQVFIVRRGRDGRWGSKDDAVRSFSTRPFGSRDPEGLEFADGALFISDGDDKEVYRIDRGSDGRFDGAPPEGDDVVTSFDTQALGLHDPEDLAYDRSERLLYLISRTDLMLVRTTLEGELVDVIDLSDFDLIEPAGIAVVPGRNPSLRRVYVADRGLDNNESQGGDPNENDGRIFEFVLTV